MAPVLRLGGGERLCPALLGTRQEQLEVVPTFAERLGELGMPISMSSVSAPYGESSG